MSEIISQQQKLVLSPYAALYDIFVPKDNMLRQINELVDFTFIYKELEAKYCLNNGRNAIDPIRIFKYLLLKAIFELSDVDIVERSKYDMSFKYFLGMAPEDSVIDPSSLTKFRKLRLKDMNLLDMLIGQTVTLAIEQDILKSTSIIVDAHIRKHVTTRSHHKKSYKTVLESCARLQHGRVTQNKDACKEHEQRAWAIRKARQGKKGVSNNPQKTYLFDVEICKCYPLKEGCYKEGAKSKTYSVTIKSDEHVDQLAFQKTEYFKAKSKERYKIEAKNSELKHGHGYDVASGLLGMQLQGAIAIFAVSLKRILKLVD